MENTPTSRNANELLSAVDRWWNSLEPAQLFQLAEEHYRRASELASMFQDTGIRKWDLEAQNENALASSYRAKALAVRAWLRLHEALPVPEYRPGAYADVVAHE